VRNRVKKCEDDSRYYQQHRDDILTYNKTPNRRAAHRANAKVQGAKRRAAIESTIEPITAEQWEDLKASYLWLCVYCLEKCDDLTMDHVVALNRGGDHTVGNVVPACRTCNREKTDKSMIVFLAERRSAA
jgi:5-methylcytosine-specific restriction endonuclease McrA